jgi:hypothetical protein
VFFIQVILQRLVISEPSVSPGNVCQLTHNINAVAKAKPAHKAFGHHAADISQVFRLLTQSPRAVASFLSAAQQNEPKVNFNDDKDI